MLTRNHEILNLKTEKYSRLVDLENLKILIVLTPKTGNMWLKLLLSRVYNLPIVSVDFDYRRFEQEFPILGNSWIAHQHYPILESDFLNFLSKKRIVLLTTIRHPGDVLVSLFHFVKWYPLETLLGKEPVSAITLLKNDDEVMGKYTQQYVQDNLFAELLQISYNWIPHVTERVHYKDMLVNPLNCLIELTNKISPVSRENVIQAIVACDINNLRATSIADQRHFRKGLQGEWKEVIPPEILHILRTQSPYPKLCSQLGYSFDDTNDSIRPVFDYATINPFYQRQQFDNGVKITPLLSHIYFSTKNALQRWTNPLETSSEECFYNWLNLPTEAEMQNSSDNSLKGLLITNLAYFIYQIRGDLRQAFPDLFGKNRVEFCQWFINQFPLEYEIERAFITPMLLSLNSNQTTKGQPPETMNVTPNTTGNHVPSNLRTKVKLYDLGNFREEYKGILSPVYDEGIVKKYITEQFLDNASVYANHYQTFSHFEQLLSTTQQYLSLNHLEPLKILDIGSGAGNTIFPLFKLYSNASIVASDLSAPLLKILKELYEKDYGARACTIVQLNAEEIVFEDNQFDLVVGSAILHHLLSPEQAIKECFRVLKPHGYAVFFEPFESGNSAVASVLLKLLELNELFHQQDEPLTPEIVRFFKAWCHDIDVRKRMSKDNPLLPQLNDKWLFTKQYFQNVSESIDGEVVIYSTSDMTKPFSNAIKVLLKLGLQLEESCLPRWAMDYILAKEENFSRESDQETMMTGGCIIFHKTTQLKTMNVIPQTTTAILAPKFKPQKSEAITSFCNFLEGGNHPQWPLEMFLELSNICDLQCAMCTTFSALSPNRFLKLKSSERGFLETADYSALDPLLQHALLVHCFGYGEPTIHPRFKEILSHVLDYEVLVDFFTNGMHLTQELCELMVEKKLFKVVISFSGANQQDYENVYLGGQFGTVLEGISRLANTKKQRHSQYPVIEINSIAFQHQIDHLIEFIDLMADKGVNQIELKSLVTYPDTPQLHSHAALFRPDIEGQLLEEAKQHAVKRDLVFNPAPFIEGAKFNPPQFATVVPISDLKSIAKTVVPVRPPKDQDVLSLQSALDQSPGSLASFFDIQKVKLGTVYCCEPFETFYVRRDGHVVPCCFSNNAFGSLLHVSMGDLAQSSGEVIWQGAGFQTIREGVLADSYPMKICRECIKLRQYPKHHAIQHKVGAYTSWFQQIFGQEFDRALQERTKTLGCLSNRDVIEKRKLVKSFINMGVAENQFAVSGSIFTLPKRVKPPYSWVEHIPFAFFLTGSLKPKIFVELGVYVGNSYNAFCQAVSLLKTATQCYGIDTWRGDEHTNFYDESVYNELFAYQQREYPEFSFLLRHSFDDMLESFEDNSIDLLHIDGFHTYEAVKHDFENWLPKVSNQGVVIFHDTEVRDHDFGVWRLWEELAQTYPSFNFKHGYGLGVIAVGTQVPQEFLNFLQVANQEPFYRELFARLGHYITVLEQNKTLEKSIPSQHLFAQLFIDTGEGFEERHSIIKTVTGEESQLAFDLSGYDFIKQLRFDPLNTLVIVRVPRIVLIDQHQVSHELESHEDNALVCQADKTLVFDTDDSLIYLDLQNYVSPQRIVFSVEYVVIGHQVQALSQILKLEHDQRQTLAQQHQEVSQNLETLQERKRTLKNLLHQHQIPTRYLVQLFIDTGAGFSEEQSMIQEVTEFTENEQPFEFDLSSYENLKQLRFDPLNAMTALRIGQIVVVDGQGLTHRLNYQPVNAYAQLGEILVFDTEDSQILITWPNLEKPQKVVIRLQYMAMGTNTYRFLLQREREIIKQQGEQIQYLTTQLVQ